MSPTVRVYVNSRPVDAPVGGTALDAVRTFDPLLADLVTSGARVVTDSRGLPVASTVSLTQGAIFRVIHARAASESQEGES